MRLSIKVNNENNNGRHPYHRDTFVELSEALLGAISAADVADAIAATAEEDDYQTQKGACNRCQRASLQLAFELEQRGVPHSIVEFGGYIGCKLEKISDMYDDGLRPFWTHCVVYVEGYIIDLTARQFDPDTPWPWISRYEDMRPAWIACEGTVTDDCDVVTWHDFDKVREEQFECAA